MWILLTICEPDGSMLHHLIEWCGSGRRTIAIEARRAYRRGAAVLTQRVEVYGEVYR